MKEVKINVFVLPISVNERCDLAIYRNKEIALDFLSADVLDIDENIEGEVTVSGFWYKKTDFIVTKIHSIS